MAAGYIGTSNRMQKIGEKQLPMGTYQVPLLRTSRIQLEPHPRSPDPNDQDEVRLWLAKQCKPWAIDLFCGAGGLSLGLEEGGFSVVAAADSDLVALETHAANIEGLTWGGDLSDPLAFLDSLNIWGIDRVDLLAGGPPCQPFSKAGMAKIGSLVRGGTREALDKRADLWRTFFAVIDRLQPKAVLLENVPEFARAQDGAILTCLVDELRNRNYSVHVEFLDAWKFRVPQHRSRLFVVACAENIEFQWPTPIGRKPNLRQAIGDLPIVAGGTREEVQDYCGPPRTTLAKILRKGIGRKESKLIRDHITRPVRPDDAEIFRLMKPGETYLDVPIQLRRYRSDIFEDKYYRLSLDEISRTITAHIAKDGYWYIHPSQNRTLSIREAARIQTFPDRFRFAGNQTNRFRQIGNAVPPLLALAIASSVRLAVKNNVPQIDETKEDGGNLKFEPPLRVKLIRWLMENDRKFPWRYSNLNEWQILLIEMCLHRTKADQVAGIAPNIIELSPTPKDFLSNARILSPMIASLGLRWRAENIVKAAEFIDDNLKGVVPNTWQELRAIPGVGDYIASAVSCFSHGRRMVLMDTNTVRIARRVLGGSSDYPAWRLRLALLNMSGRKGPDQEWNYGLLDLGALVCTSRSPKCIKCPIQEHCSTGRIKGH